MKCIILLASPGAGKGTASDYIENKYNFKHISSGSLLRKDRNRSADNNGCPRCAKSKMGTSRKKVLNVETGETFDSAIEAGKKYNTVPSAIRQCCRGVSSMSKGFHWRYVEEKIQ